MTSLPTSSNNDRRLALDGAVNFRDIGGYETESGATIKWQTLYRADGLSNLSEADIDVMRRLGISSVLDLRTTLEFEGGTFPVEHVAVELHHLPLMNDVPDPEAFKTIPGFLATSYVEMLESASTEIAKGLRIVLDPANLPAIVHCSVGKDRTGVLTALILGLLEIPRSVIIDDYALSADVMHHVRDRLVARYPEATDLIENADEIFSAAPRNMEFFLDAVTEKWGSIEAYVLSIGLSTEEIAYLRSALLDQPTP